MPPDASRRQAGQALLETLIAVAILAIALVSLLAGLVQLQERRIEAARTRHAGQLASDKLAEVELAGEGAMTNASGEFPAPDDDFSWEVALTATPDTFFRVLSVEVRSKGSRPVSVTFSRLEARP
ncbi:type II secretion system protein [Solidesulfovibrio sp.]|uniref:type IV pilus modification PilV family protein n=1 Tax=Solidesulfovibrio sp. TaxID=2910990 RepID=UPI0026251F51|nr:type II secretion system protein [Solidesulfovibrio sp.]